MSKEQHPILVNITIDATGSVQVPLNGESRATAVSRHCMAITAALQDALALHGVEATVRLNWLHLDGEGRWIAPPKARGEAILSLPDESSKGSAGEG